MKLEDALRDAEVPGERHAEERAWEAIAAAHAAREPTRRSLIARALSPRGIRPLAGALAFAAVAAIVVAVALTPPGEAVADWIKRTVDPPNAAPALRPLALPEAGRLLVESPGFGLSIVDHAGRARDLGEWWDAEWSPHGLFVIATKGRTLAALDPRGRVRWKLVRPAEVRQPAWSNDGFKVAYRSSDALRVVAGDGTGDRFMAGPMGFAGPAWQPGKGYALAWGDPAGRVHLLDVFTGRELWRSAPVGRVRDLVWSRTGSTLAAVSGKKVQVFDRSGRPLRLLRAKGHDSFEAVTLDGSGSELTLVRHNLVGGRSRVTVTAARSPRAPERPLFAGGGRITDLTYSPTGRWLLLGWRGADQWLYLRSERIDEVRAVTSVTREVVPEAPGRWAFPLVRGWAPPAP